MNSSSTSGEKAMIIPYIETVQSKLYRDNNFEIRVKYAFLKSAITQ